MVKRASKSVRGHRSSVIRKKAKTLIKKSNTRECPPDLKKIIDDVNEIPREPKIENLMNQADCDEWTLDEMIWNLMKDRPSKWHQKKDTLTNYKATLIYDYKVHSDRRRMLELCARAAQMSSLDHAFMSIAPLTKDRKLMWPGFYLRLSISPSTGLLEIDEHSAGPLLPLLLGIDPTYLRLCKICEKIFWANRKDAWTCSPRCSNTLRQKLLRDRRKKEKMEFEKANQVTLKKRRR